MSEHLGGSLSALIDGSLDAAERAAAEAHLRTCAICRGEADALRATLEDLRALERPTLTEMDRARLRSEVRRARRVPRFAMRLGAAAAVVALAAGGAMFLNRGGVDSPTAGPFAAATFDSGDYTEASARALLLGRAGPTEFSARARGPEADTYQAAPGTAGLPASQSAPAADAAAATRDVDHGARIAECEGIFLGTNDVIRVHRIVSRYEGEPAYLLTYRVPRSEPTHIELWVVSIDGCEVRFFAQEKL